MYECVYVNVFVCVVVVVLTIWCFEIARESRCVALRQPDKPDLAKPRQTSPDLGPVCVHSRHLTDLQSQRKKGKQTRQTRMSNANNMSVRMRAL